MAWLRVVGAGILHRALLRTVKEASFERQACWRMRRFRNIGGKCIHINQNSDIMKLDVAISVFGPAAGEYHLAWLAKCAISVAAAHAAPKAEGGRLWAP